MIGRIPLITGKLKADGIELMVQGDPRLRRPYLVEVVGARRSAPRRAISPRTCGRRRPRQWIATFGSGKYDDQPLFFPVSAL